MKVGNVEIHPVIDGRILSKLPATKPLPDEGSLQWQQQHGMFRPDGRIESTLGGFLLRAGDRVVLVDAGAGQAFPDGFQPLIIDPDDATDPVASAYRARGLPEPFIRQLAVDFAMIDVEQGGLPKSLSDIGIVPEDVTDLVFTHLHFDHIGWASVDGVPFFPNATVRCAAADLEHFLAGPPEENTVSQVYRAMKACDRLAPILDRIETWDRDSPVLPHLDVRLAPGHTPGSTVVVISDGAARAMLLGDVIHCPLELMDDEFDLLADHDAELAKQVRRAYAREVEDSGVPISAAHFPGLAFGRLLAGAPTRAWSFA